METARIVEIKKQAGDFTVPFVGGLYDAREKYNLSEAEHLAFCFEVVSDMAAAAVSIVFTQQKALDTDAHRKLMTMAYEKVADALRDTVVENGGQVLRIDPPPKGGPGGSYQAQIGVLWLN